MSEKYSTKSGYVSIIGCPNVGKSTLLNFLVGEKLAIVTYKPQTTRHKILGIRTENEAQIIFLDTPGIHKYKTRLNKKMLHTALDALREADVILFMIDASSPFQTEEREDIFPALKTTRAPVILLINKTDLIQKPDLLPIMEKYNTEIKPVEIFPICALTGDNIQQLVPRIIDYLPVGPHYYPDDTLTDKSVRFIVSEIIREKIIILTQQEIPYATAVSIESFKENEPNGIVKIEATILVERESQKGIVIGKKGDMLKKIGTVAREDIEKYLAGKVFLKLWVKVSQNWPDNDKALRDLGY